MVCVRARRYDPATTELSALKRLCAFSKRFVRGLHISQLPSHLDLQALLGTTTGCLTSLTLTYGMMNVGMDYDRSLFGMKLSDCRTLAKALERTETLTYLNLSNNLLDDEKVRIFVVGDPSFLPLGTKRLLAVAQRRCIHRGPVAYAGRAVRPSHSVAYTILPFAQLRCFDAMQRKHCPTT